MSTPPVISRNGTPVVHMWAAPMPDPQQPHCGFAVPEDVTHAVVYAASREHGAYSHHPKICRHAGSLHAMWSNHPHGEDGPGQRILYTRSDDGCAWSPWRELFPPPQPVLPSEEMGLVHTPMCFVVVADRLYACVGCHENIGFCDFDVTRPPVPVRDAEHPSRARRAWASVAREIRADCETGPMFALWDALSPGLAGRALPADDRRVREEAAAVNACYRQPDRLPAWDFGRDQLGYPLAVEGQRLCEPTTFRNGRGGLTMLLRDTGFSHRLYVSEWEADSCTWCPARPTDIPDSPSLSCAVSLEGGEVLLVGNQISPAFDNWDETRHHQRDPLTVAISTDSEVFSRVYALRSGRQQWRVPKSEVRGRNGGGQYPDAVVVDDQLFVVYSMGKEDIWASRVPLAALGL
jgi:hypothetical protein